MKDSLWRADLFRCESIGLKTYWVVTVIDQYKRRIAKCRYPSRSRRWLGALPDVKASNTSCGSAEISQLRSIVRCTRFHQWEARWQPRGSIKHRRRHEQEFATARPGTLQMFFSLPGQDTFSCFRRSTVLRSINSPWAKRWRTLPI
jgi:hypothetical protein